MKKPTRVPFRVIEPNEASLVLDVRPTSKVDQFVRGLSPFPRDIVARRIQQRKIPDALYDVGPDGIQSYFDAMKAAKVSALQWTIRATLFFAFGLVLIANSDVEWSDVIRFIEYHLALCTFGASVVCLVIATWHFIAAGPYRDEWQYLEGNGLFWKFESGANYRYKMIRSNGSYQIDPTTHDARIEADLYGVRDRAQIKQKSVTQIFFAVTAAAIFYFGLMWVKTTYHDVAVTNLHLYWLLPLGIATAYLPRPIKDWYEAHITQKAYDRGSQFMRGAHVSDQLPEQLTRETVEKHSPYGDADFVPPDAASRGLAG